MRSLRARLQLALGGSLLVFSVLLWFVGDRLLEELAQDLVASRLEEDAESLLAALDLGPGGALAVREAARVYARPFSGHYFAIRSGDAEILSRSLWDESLEYAAAAVGAVELRRLDGPRGAPLLLRTAGYVRDERPVTIAVAADLGAIEVYRRRLRIAVLVFAFSAALLLGVAQHAIMRVSLRPLDRVREALRALERGESDRLGERVPAEVLPLVREVNRLLTTLSRRLARSRLALGDLAHALKGPLQLLAEDLARDPVSPVASADARAQAAQIRALIERELRRARLAGGGTPAERFMVPGDLVDLCATMRQLHRGRELELDWELEGEVSPFAEREDMQELLGNLLDNACKWARRRVRIRLVAGKPLVITIGDDGPGISPAARHTALVRGARLDESREGYGLGLAIAGDIVAGYGGRLALESDPQLGGLRVIIELPLAAGGETRS